MERIARGDVKGMGVAALKKFITQRDNGCCTACGTGSVWNGKPLTLDMDHIDGDRANNLPSNLRLLCPNCHTQTETWGKKTRKVE